MAITTLYCVSMNACTYVHTCKHVCYVFIYKLQKIEKHSDYRKQFFEADINGLHLLELSSPEMAGMYLAL